MTHEQPHPEPTASKEKDFLEGVKKSLEKLFDEFDNGADRVAKLIPGVRTFLGVEGIDAQALMSKLQICESIADRQEFVSKVLQILAPLVELKRSDPKKYEKAQRTAFAEYEGFIRLNEALSYVFDEENGVVHIHLGPSKESGSKSEFIDGLKILARVMESNPKMKRVEATSWIIAKKSGRGIMSKLGFHLDGPIAEEMAKAHFDGEDRPVESAHMDREAFLERYLAS